MPPDLRPRDLAGFPALADLRARLGDEIVAVIVRAFLEDTPDILDQLESAAAAGQPRAVAMYAHALAGSAAEMGLHTLTAAGRALEQTARADPAKIPDHLMSVLALAFTGMDSLGRTFAES